MINPLRVPPAQPMSRYALSTIHELTDEEVEPVAAEHAGRLSSGDGDFAAAWGDRVETEVERAVQDQLDGLLNRFPATQPGQLRGSFLSRLDQAFARTLAGLETPGLVEGVNAELDRLEPEVEGLLRQDPLTPAERQVFSHLEASVMEAAFERFCLDRREHADAARAGLRQAARVLVARGVDTPRRVDRLLARGLSHDHWLQVCMGGVGQLGYGAGFLAFNSVLAPTLAPRLLGRGFLPAFAFGTVAGAVVGLCDALSCAGAQKVADGLAYQSSSANTAARAMSAPELRRIAQLAGIGGGTTFVKNFVLRAMLLTLLIEAVAPEGIARVRRGELDFALDAGGGLFAGALAAHLRYTLLDSPRSHAFKLLCGEDLESRIERMRRPLSVGDFATALKLFAEGVGQAAISPSTYTVVLATVAPMIGLLLAAQNAVRPGLGAVAQVLVGGVIQALGPDVQLALGGAVAVPVGSYENAVRAGISSVMMGVMAGTATAVGTAAGPRLDGPALRHCLGRAHAAVSAMRRMAQAGAAASGIGELPRRRRPHQ